MAQVAADLVRRCRRNQYNRAMPGSYRFEAGEGGLERLVISARDAEAHIYRHGAHVTHFQPHGDQPVLWLSPRSQFQAGTPIRGGVPICFPWFGAKADDPAAPSHGLVRTRQWSLIGIDELDNGSVRASFDTEAGPLMIAHTITVGRALVMRLDIYHRGKEPVTFEAALHTYLHVSDVRRVTVAGLEDATYVDKVDGSARKKQPSGPLAITGETDRVYLDTESAVEVHDPMLGRTITIDKSGSQSTVIWNPGPSRAARMPDIGDEGWSQMLCVETANVADNAIRLPPGRSQTMIATISLWRLPAVNPPSNKMEDHAS